MVRPNVCQVIWPYVRSECVCVLCCAVEEIAHCRPENCVSWSCALRNFVILPGLRHKCIQNNALCHRSSVANGHMVEGCSLFARRLALALDRLCTIAAD